MKSDCCQMLKFVGCSALQIALSHGVNVFIIQGRPVLMAYDMGLFVACFCEVRDRPAAGEGLERPQYAEGSSASRHDQLVERVDRMLVPRTRHEVGLRLSGGDQEGVWTGCG